MCSAFVNSKTDTRISKTTVKPLRRNHSIATCVSGMLGHCCPLTIARFVIPVIVDAVNRVPFGWRFPHILQKILKGIFPASANAYAASSIAFVSYVVWISAPTFHCQPTLVRMAHAIPRVPMYYSVATTATRFSAAEGKAISHHLLNSSAFTFTYVVYERSTIANSGFCLCENFKLSEGLSDKRYFVWHNVNGVTASGGLSAQTDARCDSSSIFQQAGQIHCLASSGFGAKLLNYAN